MMMEFMHLIPMLLGIAGTAAPAETVTIPAAVDGPAWAGLILLFPALSCVLCGVCAALKLRSKAPAWITVASLAASFATTLALYLGYQDGQPQQILLFHWFNLIWDDGSFVANFALYIDSLTLLWMLFVTGLGTLIALYASEYMESDVGKGYARFFAGVSIFLFAMGALVMGDNLVMLYLGWEGVGFASYWLIGYYYTRPSAVAAAKKAFIMNRIGDLGLALAIYFIWQNFGTVRYDELLPLLVDPNAAYTNAMIGGWSVTAIPFLLMLGAFGKSAQLPLYVWLPDAMEGPTPVSALIHAATMVTAGVYLLCRMYPALALHPTAPATVAWIGALTALLAATIGMAQYDIKRIMAYSTVSQLGYMFLGVGVMTTYGAAYHVFTHAFFKAVLFLTCGAIMHGFAGQLDLRKLSGLGRMKGWRIVTITMGYACACLAGVPFVTSGFYSKDMIMAEAYANHAVWGAQFLGGIALLTAFLTAYYTFRVFFRVCMGPAHYEMGDEHHGGDDDHGHDHAHGHDDHHHAHEPHAPRLAINFVLVVIAIGAAVAIIPYYTGWVKGMVAGSSAAGGIPGHHEVVGGFWSDPHRWMPWVASVTGLAGIALAWWFHLAKRKQADDLRAMLLGNPVTRWLPTAMENKWYVDEVYHGVVRLPLWVLSHIFHLFDQFIIDKLIVNGLFGGSPRALGRSFQPLQNGILQGYAVTMAGGVGLVLFFVWLMWTGVLN